MKSFFKFSLGINAIPSPSYKVSEQVAELRDRKDELRVRLLQASENAMKHRIARLMRHPWKTIFPVVVRSLPWKTEFKTPTFWGGNMNVVLPEPVSTSIWRYGFFETDVSLYIINHLREGMTFLDVGGHFGFFTLLGSFLVGEEGKVLAIEPTPSTYAHLIKNISLHSSFRNIETFNCAAYSENTDIKFYDYGLEGSAYNSAFPFRRTGIYDNKRKEVIVSGRKIDDLLTGIGIRGVELIKIDAEASELHVLNGMAKTIDTYRPIIILEVGDSESIEIPSSKKAVSWLQQRGYKTYEVRSGGITPHICQEKYEYGNLLFMAKQG